MRPLEEEPHGFPHSHANVFATIILFSRTRERALPKEIIGTDDFNLPIRCFGNADEPVPVPFTNRFDNRLFDYSPRSCICD